MKKLLVSLLLAAFLLAACGDGSEDETSTSDDGTVESDATDDEVIELVFRQNDPPMDVLALEDAVERWNEENPDIQVSLEHVAWEDARQQLVREVQAQQGPDIAQVGFVWTQDLGADGLLLGLNGLASESPPGAGIDDFIGLDLATVGDELYGLPWTVDTGTFVYRSDILDEAGVDDFPDTWEGLHSLAVELADGPRAGFCYPAGDPWFLVNAYLWTNGTSLVIEDGDGWDVGVTEDDLRSAMEYFNSFFADGATPTSLIGVTQFGAPEITQGLIRGDCAISFIPIAPFESLTEEHPDVPLRSAMVPSGTDGSTSFLGGRALTINPNSEHPEEAFAFASYLTTPEVFEDYNWWPAQNSAVEELEFPESQLGYQEMLPRARTFRDYVASPASVDALSDSLTRSFQDVYTDQEDAAQAATDLLADITARLD